MIAFGVALAIVWLAGFVLTLPSVEAVVGFIHRIPDAKDWENAVASVGVVVFGAVWPITALSLYIMRRFFFKDNWPVRL